MSHSNSGTRKKEDSISAHSLGSPTPSISSINKLFRHRVWYAKIPVVIKISEGDLRLVKDDPVMRDWAQIKGQYFYQLVPRTFYLPLLLPQLRRHYDMVFTAFSNRRPSNPTEMIMGPWLEFGGHPLAWHLPLGLLFDECRRWEACSLPWNITLHFTSYPFAQLFPLTMDEILEEGSGGPVAIHYYSMLKQSEYLRRGSSRKIMNLSKAEQIQLWDGLWTHSFDAFWSIYGGIIDEDEMTMWKSIPLRFYLHQNEGIVKRRVLQGPISPNLTLLQAYETLIQATNETITSPTFVIHGLEIPGETPLSWLAIYLIHPDGFLHILIS